MQVKIGNSALLSCKIPAQIQHGNMWEMCPFLTDSQSRKESDCLACSRVCNNSAGEAVLAYLMEGSNNPVLWSEDILTGCKGDIGGAYPEAVCNLLVDVHAQRVHHDVHQGPNIQV